MSALKLVFPTLEMEARALSYRQEYFASARTIVKNGGVLENEVAEEDGTVLQRYWIDIPQ